MFTSIIPVGKGVRRNKAASLLFAICIAAAVVFVAGCKDEPDEKGSLIGTWTSSAGDSYTIGSTAVTYSDPYKDTAHTPPWADASFQGTIRNNPSFENESGVIIIEYVTKPTDGAYDANYQLTGPGTQPAGNFIAVYWKDLTTSSISLATATNLTDYSNPATATLGEAETKFTIAKAGDFVGQWGAYSK